MYNDEHTSSHAYGFSFIELIIVLAILGILAAAATPLYSQLQTSTQLNETTTELTQAVRIARTRAVARVNDASHGIYLEPSSDRYTLYQGASYASRSSGYDRVVTLDSALTLSTTLTGNEVNFSKGRGEPSNTGSITISHDVQGSTSITIDALGSVQQ